MACQKAAVALLTFSPPEAKAWLYDLIDANPATGIMLCRRHANATVVPMSWQLIDSRDPAWSPPGEPAAPQPEPAAIPGLLTEATVLTEPLIVEPSAAERSLAQQQPVLQPAGHQAAEPAMATILSTTVQRPAAPVAESHQPAPAYEAPVAEYRPTQPIEQLAPSPAPATPQTTHHTAEPAAFTPTVTAPPSTAAMPASPMVGTAAVAVVAPPLPAPHIDPPVPQPIARRTETIRVEARPGERVSHVVGLNEQIAAHARPVEQQWAEPAPTPGPPGAADLVANLQERLLPDPSLFELPLDTPAVTPHQGYR